MRRPESTAFFADDGFTLALLGRDAHRWGVRCALRGARGGSLAGDLESSGRVSSRVGPRGRWSLDRPAYGRVAWEEIRPGVDMLAEPTPGGLAYRFVLSPGAQVSDLGMVWEGATAVRAVDGGVDVETGLGALRIRGLRALAILGGREVELPARFVVHESRVDLEVDGWSGDVPLIIDPTIAWGAFLGGASNETGRGVGVDKSGNVIVTGAVNSTDFPTLGAFDATLTNGPDAFVTKMSSTGALVWSTYLGGNGADIPYDLAIDGAGNALLTGETTSTDYPTNAGFDTTHGGLRDAFVTKVSSAGALVWSSYLGGADDDIGYAIATDASDNVVLTGSTRSTGLATTGAYDTTVAGEDGFVVKVSATGALLWSSYLGGASFDRGRGIAVDGSGNVLVTGITGSTDYPTTGGFDTTLSNTDAFVTKFSTTGSLVWSSVLGGSNLDNGFAIAVDAAGNAYVAGQTQSSDFPTTGGWDTTYSGQDGFVTKVTSAGALAWSTFVGGGAAGESVEDVAVDGSANVLLVGYTPSTDFPTTGGFDTSYNGGTDGFVVKLDTAGALLWSSYLGGTGIDQALRVAVAGNGDALVAGYTTSSSASLPVSGGFDTTVDAQDAFVVKLAFGAAGAACSTASDCLSGYCADGVCCNVVCTGGCVACTAGKKGSGTDGTCGPVAADTDPKAACAAGTGTCAADGSCDGAGACRSFAKPGTPCGPTACTAGVVTGQVCKGDSAVCTTSTGVACAPYACAAGACKTSCTVDTECDAAAWCSGSVCVDKSANGKACTEGRACVSGLCVDGVCCNSSCAGQCESCGEPGTVGTCTAVAGKPRGARAACDALGADDCARTTCDGSIREKCGGFANGTTTTCGARSCTADKKFQDLGNCDGRGKCGVPAAVPCTPFACDVTAASGCKTNCASGADCADGFTCTGGACVQGATCNADKTASIDKVGGETLCAPYRCGSDGNCLQACTGSEQCASGWVCDPSSKTCLQSAAPTEDSGGCSHGGRSGGSGAAVLLSLALAAVCVRKRG